MARVVFQDVVKRFESVHAVDNVSFDIEDGEFICLLGPSGCGKTTTLRMIAGLEQPTSGSISIGEREVTHLPPKDRDIGMVFQDYALYPHMTLADNISYPLKVRGVNPAERRKQAELAAKSLQIDHLLDRRPGQISGGQQQRTSVARAVVHKPQVFLFDEPLSNLDAKLRLEARSFLKHLQRSLGVTAIYVTHDQAEAMALADRIAVMEGGKIVQLGAPLEVYRAPATTFVANFLGSPPMNLLSVKLERREGRLELVGEGFSLDAARFAVPLGDTLPSGSPLTLGIRPEHLRLGDVAGGCQLSGEVYAVEPLGPESLVTLSMGGVLTTMRIFEDDPPQLDKRARFSFDPAHAHLFGPSGERY